MHIFKKRWIVMWAILLLALTACGGGSSSPTNPEPDNVSGVWTFTGQLSSNACAFDPVRSINGDITFFQAGTAISTGQIALTVLNDVAMDFVYAGTLTGSNISMAAVNPYVFRSGGSVRHIGSGIEVQNIRNNAGTGSLNLTWQCIEGCTGSCQTVWTGTWTQQ